jgi:serine/threonine-protein kinase
MATATIQRFGRYRLDALIGQGALAEVHTARHIRTGATVALKVFHPHLVAQPGFAERFAAISRSLKTLSHRGIVPVTDAVLENGQAYLATEFLSSETLEDRLASAQLERRRFPLQDVIKWMELLCEAVDFAHAHEVVHGDLKPGNIMFNQAGEPVILDFALLRLVDRPATHNAHQIPGTPEYLAPEQARGKPADKLSDVYALGVILYELLTGQTPFQGNKVAVVMKHQSEPPPSPRQLGLQLPAGVEAVLMRALAKDAGERFPSPLALSRALRAAVERAAVAAKDEGTPVTASAPTYANSVSGWPEQAEVVTGKPAVVVDEPPRRPTNWRAIWAAVAAGVAGLAIIGGLAAWALAQEAAEVVGPKGLPRFSSGQFVQVIIDSDNAGASMLRGCPSIFWNGVLGVAYEGDVGRVLERRTCDGNWFYRVAFPDYATDEWDGTGWMDGRYLATR